MALDNSRLEPWLGRFVVGNEGKTMPCLPPMTGSISLSGWWYTYPSEKYESQLGSLFPIYGKIKNVPNHQPAYNLNMFINFHGYLMVLLVCLGYISECIRVLSQPKTFKTKMSPTTITQFFSELCQQLYDLKK